MVTAPPPYEIRYATPADGTVELDEVIARDAHVHLEKMNDAQWWLGIDLPDGTHIAVNLGTHSEGEYAWAEVEIPPTRPAGCCGACPPIERGGYDCTCSGNPRCPNHTATTPTHAPNRDALGLRSAEQATDEQRDGRDESRPAERRTRKRHQPSDQHWHVRHSFLGSWLVYCPAHIRGHYGWWLCRTCTIRPTWQAAIDHVTQQLRNHALTAIENQEATNQPQEDQ